MLPICRHQLPKAQSRFVISAILDVWEGSSLAEDEQKMAIISTTTRETPFFLIIALIK